MNAIPLVRASAALPFVKFLDQIDQPSDAICFSKYLLSTPSKHLEKHYFSDNSEIEGILQSTTPTPDFVGSIQQMLRSLLHDGYPDVALAAEAAGMSIRSFQRRLAESNLNYSLLVEQVRFDEAVRLLQDSTLKLIDIAFELGYTDAANFSRAFRRWTGISPYKFRLLNLKIKSLLTYASSQALNRGSFSNF